MRNSQHLIYDTAIKSKEIIYYTESSASRRFFHMQRANELVLNIKGKKSYFFVETSRAQCKHTESWLFVIFLQISRTNIMTLQKCKTHRYIYNTSFHGVVFHNNCSQCTVQRKTRSRVLSTAFDFEPVTKHA